MACFKGIFTQDFIGSAGTIGSDLIQERIEPAALQARSENQPESQWEATRS